MRTRGSRKLGSDVVPIGDPSRMMRYSATWKSSVEAFPSPEAFVQLLRDCGFSAVRAIPLTMGVVYMFVATKGDSGAV